MSVNNPILAALANQNPSQPAAAQIPRPQATMNNPLGLITEFAKFKKSFTESGNDPYAVLEQLINSGKMSKEQFMQLKDEAQSLMYLFK